MHIFMISLQMFSADSANKLHMENLRIFSVASISAMYMQMIVYVNFLCTCRVYL